MDMRLIFDEEAENYDRWRPTYTPELFTDIVAYSNLGAECRALEVGLGTGQATTPILSTGCHVTALELGGNLAAFSRQKFSSHSNLDVLNVAFEDYDGPERAFDLLYSATAFHWIPPEIGYPKARGLLRKGGTLALFWNHPFPASPDDPLHQALQALYTQYQPSSGRPKEHTEEKCKAVAQAIKGYGFTDVQWTLYRQTRSLDAVQYCALLNTYSDHRAMPEQLRIPFEREIADTIHRMGGIMRIHDTMDLYLAKAP